MNAALACAPSDTTWHGINWADVHRQVRRLQVRIAKVVFNCRFLSNRTYKGLSRVQLKLPARFLGGDGAVMRRPYPTKGSNAFFLPDNAILVPGTGFNF